jgi:hypothetical protein
VSAASGTDLMMNLVDLFIIYYSTWMYKPLIAAHSFSIPIISAVFSFALS